LAESLNKHLHGLLARLWTVSSRFWFGRGLLSASLAFILLRAAGISPCFAHLLAAAELALYTWMADWSSRHVLD